MVISGFPPDELAELIAPLPRYRADQIIRWIASGASSFAQMSNLPLPLRDDLSRRFELRPWAACGTFRDEDGTIKIVLEFSDGAEVEAVLLADGQKRYTACLSTQAGCPVGCIFCKTGTQFIRNLDSSEIVEQFLQLRHELEKDEPLGAKSGHSIDNIVIMGMGEPLLNLAELRRALAVVASPQGSPQGLHFSRKRITVSTCGIAEGIADLADNGPMARLALSLTAADESLRRELMPIAASQPLSNLKGALRYFQGKGGGRITLEAVLLGGINTRSEDASAIAAFASGLDAVVNLIPWNPVNGLAFRGRALQEPSSAEVEFFARKLEDLGMNVTRRFRRGRGVSGACGQLGRFQEFAGLLLQH